MFENELRQYVGRQVQLVTAVDTVSGVLVSVTSAVATVRTSKYPGYGGAENVTVQLDAIAYARVFT